MIITGYKKLDSPVDEEELKEFLYKTVSLIAWLNATPLQAYYDGIIVELSSQFQ